MGKQRKKIEYKNDENVVIGNADDLVRMMPKTSYHSAWDTPEAFYKHLRTQDPKKQWDSAGRDPSTGHMKDFFGTQTFDEALDLAENGWDDGVKKVESVRNRIQMLNPIAPRLVNWSIAGAIPSVPRAVAGNILNMRTPDLTKSKKRPVITIVSNMCVSGGTSHECITNRAAVVAALIDEMESKGFSCEVVATALSGSRDFNAATSVIAKTSSQPVDIRRLSFALGHSSMFRRMFFADWGGHPVCQKLGYGLGIVADFAPSEDQNDKHIYYLPGGQNYTSMFKTEEKAATEGLDFLIKSLRAQGCPAFPKLDPDEKAEILEDKKDMFFRGFSSDDEEWDDDY